MSLSLNISASEEKNSLIIYDCTGNYSVDNKTGYGVPNLKIEDVMDAFFEIKGPNWQPGQDPIKITVYPDLPNKEGLGYEVLPSALGNPTEIESGKYEIKYTVIFKDKKGTQITKTAFYTIVCIKSVTCCIDKRMKEVNRFGANDPKQQKIIELSNLLESVCYQIECGNFGTANQDIEYLKSQCKCCGC